MKPRSKRLNITQSYDVIFIFPDKMSEDEIGVFLAALPSYLTVISEEGVEEAVAYDYERMQAHHHVTTSQETLSKIRVLRVSETAGHVTFVDGAAI